jgi:hypothetical protein
MSKWKESKMKQLIFFCSPGMEVRLTSKADSTQKMSRT